MGTGRTKDSKARRGVRPVWARIALLAALLGALTMAAPAQAAQTVRPDRTGTSDYSEVYERDVFVIVGSTLRHPDAATDPAAPLFNDSGSNLGITWGQWMAGQASADLRLRPREGDTKVELNLSGLVPGGVYSVFYGTLNPDSENPSCPGVERTLPLTSTRRKQMPDPSSFVAAADGTAGFTGIAEANLLTPLQSFFSIIYHSDGAAHHPYPNLGEQQSVTNGTQPCRSSFGIEAMRQLIVIVDN